MLFVYFKAPFGAFRVFQSVEMAVTADFLTHSAAYSLLLGLAGIAREHKKEYMGARIAVGMKGESLPLRGRVYQQLHWVKLEGRVEKRKGKPGRGESYTLAIERSKGTKPDIRPYVREFLHGLEGYIWLEHPKLEKIVSQGIKEPSLVDYWGLPFMGDNNFFVERLDAHTQPMFPCHWFSELDEAKRPAGERLFYLSVWTDYAASERSDSRLFYLNGPSDLPPDGAKIEVKERVSELKGMID